MISDISLADLSAPTLLLLLILMLFRGWIVTKRENDDVRQQRDTWRSAAEKEKEHNRQTDEVLALIVDMLKSIKRAGAESNGDRT